MIQLVNQKVTIANRKIILCDTPEVRLRVCDKNELKLIAEIGGNSITCTTYGGDGKDVHPWNETGSDGFGNPASGFDEDKLNRWLDYFTYANSLGIVPFVLLSEKENHFRLNDTDKKAFLDKMASKFDHLDLIYQHEEFPVGHSDYIRKWFGYLKSISRNLVAIHNDTDIDIWTGLNAYIDLVGLQTKLATGNSSISKAFNAGFAVFQSELVGGSASSDWKAWCRMSPEMSSGAGAYFQADDLKAPQYVSNRLKYEPQYKIMVSELGGNVPTPKNKVILTYNQERVNLIIEP